MTSTTNRAPVLSQVGGYSVAYYNPAHGWILVGRAHETRAQAEAERREIMRAGFHALVERRNAWLRIGLPSGEPMVKQSACLCRWCCKPADVLVRQNALARAEVV